MFQLLFAVTAAVYVTAVVSVDVIDAFYVAFTCAVYVAVTGAVYIPVTAVVTIPLQLPYA